MGEERKLRFREIISGYFNEININTYKQTAWFHKRRKFVLISAHVPLSVNLTFSVLVHINDFLQQDRLNNDTVFSEVESIQTRGLYRSTLIQEHN